MSYKLVFIHAFQRSKHQGLTRSTPDFREKREDENESAFITNGMEKA